MKLTSALDGEVYLNVQSWNEWVWRGDVWLERDGKRVVSEYRHFEIFDSVRVGWFRRKSVSKADEVLVEEVVRWAFRQVEAWRREYLRSREVEKMVEAAVEVELVVDDVIRGLL